MTTAANLFRFCKPGLGLATNENHWCVEYLGARRILFSFAKKGYALSCHFASDKEGLRYVKQAINDFCEWAFWAFGWCRQILANIEKPSVERVVKRCQFSFLAACEKGVIYVRLR